MGAERNVTGRVYERKFDWDKARELHAQGLPITRIAERFGVTWTAVYRVVVPGVSEKMRATSDAWMRGGVCDDCGGPMNRMSRSCGSTRCKECADKARVKMKDGQAFCPKCDTWKPVEDFSPSSYRKHRPVHTECRACDTSRKRAYRARNQEQQRAYDREYQKRRRARQEGAVT